MRNSSSQNPKPDIKNLQSPTRLSLLLLLLLSGCAEEPQKNEIVIGLNPAERAENVQRNADVLARMIAERTGMPVKIFVAQDYSGLVEAMRGRTVDFAFFAPVSYVFAERIAGARVLLKAEREGRPYYFGSIVVNADSSYRTIADLKGKDIAWVDPTSASGHLFPKAALIEAGVDPDKHFGNQIFAGRHDAVLLAVINGTITAGATYANDSAGGSGSWTQLGEGAFKGKVRAIFFSRPIPGDNLATTQFMLDEYPEIVRKVKDAVQRITDTEAGKKMMQQMYHVDQMVPATSADYDPVRNAADLLNLDISGRIAAADSAAGDSTAADSAATTRAQGRQQERERNETISIIVLGLGLLCGIGVLATQTLRGRRREGVAMRSASNKALATSTEGMAAGMTKGMHGTIGTTEGMKLAAEATAAPEGQFMLRDVSVIYRDSGGGEFTALRDVSLDIHEGEFIAVIGLSGAGKSTLLRALNRMNEPSSGTILFEGKDVTHVQGKELTELRRRIGFIFQQFNLVRNISVFKNVLAGRLSYMSWLDSMLGRFPKQDQEIALRYLREVGLADKVHNRADRLSGGQQQRVAIARALAQRPNVILADEPMASLDPKLSEVILGLLRRFNQEENITVVVNLHVLELAKNYADRIIGLQKGKVVFDGRPEELTGEVVERIYGEV